MAEIVAYGVVEHSEDVACGGSIVLVKAQKEWQTHRFCTNFCHINTVSIQHIYLLPSIPEIVD